MKWVDADLRKMPAWAGPVPMPGPKKAAYTCPYRPSHCVLQVPMASSFSSCRGSETLMLDPRYVKVLLSFSQQYRALPLAYAKEPYSNTAKRQIIDLDYQLCLVQRVTAQQRQKIVLQGGWHGGTRWDADKGKASHCIWEVAEDSMVSYG